MCTAIVRRKMRHILARTLDAKGDIFSEVLITPRNAPLRFSDGSISNEHHAMIGMGILREGFPLLFDGMNEVGLAVAALNFPSYSYYFPPRTPFRHIASYELITRILSSCDAVLDAEKLLSDAVITDTPFSDEVRPTPLHWIISDKTGSIVAEQTEGGLKIYNDPYGVLANSPPFPYQTSRLTELSAMSAENPKRPLFSEIEYTSNGCGAIGLPGDFSSPSRFMRAAFMVRVGIRGEDEISDAFHIMDTLSIPRGAVISTDGEVHHTLYTACMDTERKTYYFHTNENRGIRAVRMDSQRARGSRILGIGIRKGEDIAYL